MPKLGEVIQDKHSRIQSNDAYDHVSETDNLFKNHQSKDLERKEPHSKAPINPIPAKKDMVNLNKIKASPISHEKIFSAILHEKLSANEIYTLISIYTQCDKMQELFVPISLNQLQKLSGVGSTNLPRVLSKLLERDIITKSIQNGISNFKINAPYFESLS